MRRMQSPPLRIASPARAALHALGIVLALAVPLAGCASRSTVEDLQRRIQELERENFRLQKDLAESRVRRQMDRETRAGTSGVAGQGSVGRSAAESPAAPMEEGVASSSVIHSEPITDASAWTGTPAPGATRTGSAGTAERMMEAAQSSLDAHDPESALTHFRDVVTRHPDSALADDAQFGMGECYFQMGRYEDAMTEYRRVAEQFPFGDRVAYAFLKVGFSQLALDQRDAALESFRTVSQAYPGTEAATVARQQIAHLSRR
jgi:tol-pal system protein YbgF